MRFSTFAPAFLMLSCINLTGNFQVNAEELTNQELFKQLDQNNDGEVTRSEVTESQMVYFDRLLRKGDSNKDGRLSLNELSQGLKDPAPSMNLESAGGPGGRRSDYTPDQLFDMMDRNKDGKIQRSEIPPMAKERLENIFNFLDTDELTKDEYLKIMQRMMGPGMMADGNNRPGQMPKPSPEQLTLMLERMDQNKDGKISSAEVPERAKPMVAQLRRRLGKQDADTLSIEEIKKNLGQDEEMKPEIKPEMNNSEMKRPGRPQPPGKNDGEGNMFQQMDKNSDGSISRDEAPERMKQFFDRIDADNNGKLSPAELEKARQQREKK